jgi:hypothetical protein
MKTQYNYIHFNHVGKSKSGKTDIYECYNSENGTYLGKVSYYAGWYKYVFEPNNELKLIFENKCLRDIAEFTEMLSKMQREKSKKVKV